MRVETELMRGAGPTAVLKLLEGGKRYGYELVQALDHRSGGVLAMGQSTLYPLLYNLESQGLIVGRWEESPGSRSRKYYSLTSRGKKRLADDVKQWERLTKAMMSLGILSGDPPFAPEGAAS